MVDFKELESLLKEVIGGKKLSGSKLTKLQEMCMKSLKYDTKLVSILYRNHKSIPKSQKVSSLYVFDALARAAKHQASKHSLPIKEIPSDKPGNAGSFLFKLEGILDGLIEDMVAVETPEATEKTRKVLEIWKKANTFPPDVLSRLLQSVNGPGKAGTAGEAVTTTPPGTPPSATQKGEDSATAALNDLPPAIRALLGNSIPQETKNAPLPPTPSTAPPPATTGLEPSQLALLQQLTQQAQLGAALGSLSSVNIFPTQPLGASLPSGGEQSHTTGPAYVPPIGSSAKRYQDERDDPRRPYNRVGGDRYDSPSGTYSNAGRPPRDRHDHEEGYRRRDAGGRWERPPPPRRENRSRSRSPPSRTEQRIHSPSTRTQAIPTFTSESIAKPTLPVQPIVSQPAIPKPNVMTGGIGLDSFDISNFDMTSAASWMSLGAAFKATHGRDGTQEELINTFTTMKSAMAAPSFPASAAPSMIPANTWKGPYQQERPYMPPAQKINTWESREADEARRGGRQVGHGSYDDGVGYAMQPGRYQHSDAIVLTGGDS